VDNLPLQLDDFAALVDLLLQQDTHHH